MPSLVKKLISSFNPPDIRKFYKIHREIVHFMVRSAVKVNDGHFDKYVTAPDGHNIRVRIYPPRTIGNSTRLLVFYHGGGWVIDDIDRYHKVCRQLAEMTGSYVLSVDYRLAPEHKYPAGLDDCYEVTRQVFASAAKYGIKKRNIILIGDSAGGNLAAAVSLRARDRHEFRVRRQILIYPATACEFGDDSPYLSMRQNGKGCLLTAERMRGYLDLYLNDISQKDDPYVSPIKAASLKGLPETLIITAENDPLRDEGEAFGKRLYNAGGNVRAFRIKNAYHGFFGTDLLRHPHAKEAVSIIMYFLRLTD